MIEANPDAVYDCLYIGNRLQRKMNDFSMYEIQFFAYFSCLLSLYEGNAVETWNYSFVRTELGSPYSSDIHKGISVLLSTDFIVQSHGEPAYYQITSRGSRYLEFIEQSIASISIRRRYLDTACDSASLLPIGSIKEAINSEPVLSSAKNSMRKNLLLETNPATKVLHAQFKSLKTALQDTYNDLIIPAAVWIEALNSKNAVEKL